MFGRKSSVGVIHTSDDYIIMGRRRDTRAWTFVGGGKEMFETPKACLIREIREETGITAQNIEFVKEAKAGKNHLVYIYNVFLNEAKSGLNLTTIADPDQEFMEIGYFKREDIAGLHLHFPIKENVVLEAMGIMRDSIVLDAVDNNILRDIKKQNNLLQKAKLIREFKSLSPLQKAKLIKGLTPTKQKRKESGEEVAPEIQKILDILKKEDLDAEDLAFLTTSDIDGLEDLAGAEKLKEAIVKLITKLSKTMEIDSIVGEKIIKNLSEIFFNKEPKNALNEKQDMRSMVVLKKALKNNPDIRTRLMAAIKKFEA